VNQQGFFVAQVVLLHFLPAGPEQALVDVDAAVMARLQVIDEVQAAAQTPAADIQKIVLGQQPLFFHELELELAHFFPHAADRAPMPVGCPSACRTAYEARCGPSQPIGHRILRSFI